MSIPTAARPGKPRAIIPPTRLIRRAGARKWHIRDGDLMKAMCGVRHRQVALTVTRNASDIGCESCVIEAIRQRASRPAQPPKVTP